MYLIIYTFVIICTTSLAHAGDLTYYSHYTARYWQIWVMDEHGQNKNQITKDMGDKRNPLPLLNEKALIYETNRGELYQLSLDGNEKKRLFKQLPYINSTDIRTDGKTLALAVFRTDTQDLSNIWIADLTGVDSPKRVTNETGVVRNPRWHPNDNKILYTVYKKGEPEKIHLLDLDTGKSEIIMEDTANNIYASFSPDGESIVYASDTNGNYDIWIMDVATKVAKPITSDKALDSFPCWTKDGKQIIYVSNEDENLHIWIIEKDGKNKRQLTSGKNPGKDPMQK